MDNPKVIHLPYQINPLIKLTRWTLLVFGIIYGFKKQKYLIVAERARVEQYEREFAERDAQLDRERKLLQEAQLNELGEILFGTSSTTTNEENPVNEQ